MAKARIRPATATVTTTHSPPLLTTAVACSVGLTYESTVAMGDVD